MRLIVALTIVSLVVIGLVQDADSHIQSPCAPSVSDSGAHSFDTDAQCRLRRGLLGESDLPAGWLLVNGDPGRDHVGAFEPIGCGVPGPLWIDALYYSFDRDRADPFGSITQRIFAFEPGNAAFVFDALRHSCALEAGDESAVSTLVDDGSRDDNRLGVSLRLHENGNNESEDPVKDTVYVRNGEIVTSISRARFPGTDSLSDAEFDALVERATAKLESVGRVDVPISILRTRDCETMRAEPETSLDPLSGALLKISDFPRGWIGSNVCSYGDASPYCDGRTPPVSESPTAESRVLSGFRGYEGAVVSYVEQFGDERTAARVMSVAKARASQRASCTVEYDDLINEWHFEPGASIGRGDESLARVMFSRVGTLSVPGQVHYIVSIQRGSTIASLDYQTRISFELRDPDPAAWLDQQTRVELDALIERMDQKLAAIQDDLD